MIFIVVCFLSFFMNGCVTNTPAGRTAAGTGADNNLTKAAQTPKPAGVLYTSIPSKIPRWALNLPAYNESIGNEYFWGFSGKCATLQEAMAHAENDAKLRVAGSIAELIEGSYSETSIYKTNMEQVVEDTETINMGLSSYTGTVIEAVKIGDDDPATEDIYQKHYPDGTIEVQIIVNVSRAAMEEARSQFREEISKEYTNRINTVNRAAVYDAILGYEDIRRSFNPLTRTAALYGGGVEKCYDVVIARLRELARGLRLDDFTTGTGAYTVQKNIPLNITAVIQSELPAGPIECLLRHDGIREPLPFTVYQNKLRFQIDTSRLSIGRHRCSVELSLNSLSPELQNLRREFVFEVINIAASWEVRFTGDLPARFGKAEQTGAEAAMGRSIQQAVQRYQVPITLEPGGDYCFVVTAEMKPYPTGITGCIVTISLEHRGVTVAQSRSGEIRDTDLGLLFRKFVADHIVNDGGFFTLIKERL